MAALKLRELRAGNQSFIFYLFIYFYFFFFLQSFKINYLAAAGPSVARRTLIFAGK